MANHDIARAFARYIAGAGTRALPPEVVDAARLCLADWVAVALGAAEEDAARLVRATIAGWRSAGGATVLLDGTAAAPFAALANGTLAHCLDFDDTYVDAVTHTSAPVWAATLALGEARGADAAALLAAFVTGFEVAARAGHKLGEAVTARGWHGTGVFGRLGAAAASAALLGLDETRAAHALALAATQTSGLTGSFGTMAKPFHAGKAAQDGVVSAELAAAGFLGAPALLEPGGLDRAVIQDGSLTVAPPDFADWKILRNSFKLYAACHLTHASIDAARALVAAQIELDAVERVRARVGALAAQITGQTGGAPDTALAGKFDLKYCVALALHGREVSADDFREPWRLEPALAATAGKIQVERDPAMGFAAARLELALADGKTLAHDIPVGRGHPGNPMTWDDLWRKFSALVEPRLRHRTAEAFELLRGFGADASLPRLRTLLASVTAPRA
jgi:2-methylcitrate dehydratase PrpD